MNIEIIEYIREEDQEPYLQFVRSKYDRHKSFDYFFKDLKKALTYALKNECQKTYFIRLWDGRRDLVAHAGLTLDDRLGTGVGQFGYLECIRSMDVFQVLWDELIRLAKRNKMKRFIGPVNASTWHQYRVVKRSDRDHDFFISEPLTEEYYNEYMHSMEPSGEITYHSGARTQYDTIIGITQSSYSKLIDEGIVIEHLTSIPKDIALSLFSMSKDVFKSNWGYLDLSEVEFLELYSEDKRGTYLNSMYIIRDQSKLIGFCSNIVYDQTLVLKTMAVLPEYQGIGAGNALVYRVHADAKGSGIKKIIYALIRDDNKIRFFPKDDAIIFREYACFEYDTEYDPQSLSDT